MNRFSSIARWRAFVLLVSLLSISSAFSLSQVYYLKDASLRFWPMHLWLRRTIFDGQWPIWDPYVAFGQPTMADPLRQVGLLPLLPLRLVLPEALGFNLTLALVFPCAALGMFAFLRRHASPSGAAIGALVFGLSGPVVSMGPYPNLSWALALLPWILAGVDRLAEERSVRSVGLLAVAFGIQIVAGEALTVASTCILAGLYALVSPANGAVAVRRRLETLGLTAASGATGLLLAAFQVFPLLEALGKSRRGRDVAALTDQTGKLHPFSLVETLSPSVFGSWVESTHGAWGSIGGDDLMISVYLGVGALALALHAVGARDRRRATIFWCVVLVVALVLAFGINTPIYPALRSVIAPLQSFRGPIKFALVSTLAFAVLVAFGWDRLSSPGARKGVVAAASAVAALAAILLIGEIAAPASLERALTGLAAAVGNRDPEAGARFLVDKSLPSAAPRLLVLAAATAVCIWVGGSGGGRAWQARAILFGLVVADLLVVAPALNPLIETSRLDEPGWVAVTRAHPNDRIYVGHRVTMNLGRADPDAVSIDKPSMHVELRPTAIGAIHSNELAFTPSPWRLREGFSVDLALIWPREYWLTLEHFAARPLEDRARFLSRTGTRYHVKDKPPIGVVARHHEIEDLSPIALYETADPLSRASLVPGARVEQDFAAAIDRLFAEEFDPTAEVLVGAEPPPAGRPGEGLAPRVTIVTDTATEIALHAEVPAEGAYLLVLDGYDPNWTARVDGEATTVLRANGLFRAVRLNPGSHEVRFVYWPSALLTGLAVSLLTAIVLLVACLRSMSLR
jgi:hypothetical protein